MQFKRRPIKKYEDAIYRIPHLNVYVKQNTQNITDFLLTLNRISAIILLVKFTCPYKKSAVFMPWTWRKIKKPCRNRWGFFILLLGVDNKKII